MWHFKVRREALSFYLVNELWKYALSVQLSVRGKLRKLLVACWELVPKACWLLHRFILTRLTESLSRTVSF